MVDAKRLETMLLREDATSSRPAHLLTNGVEAQQKRNSSSGDADIDARVAEIRSRRRAPRKSSFYGLKLGTMGVPSPAL